ncbi:MAG: Capsule biosynthesis protein CapA [Chlamydiae bacterium]|nr:Capsule biosynthesis protein CapA [Chlamydiota bacterium]
MAESGISPYSLICTIRYLVNLLFNGFFSYINPDSSKMDLLRNQGRISYGNLSSQDRSTLKVIFLGDVMMSRSGEPPRINPDLSHLLESADIIVANIESPVVNNGSPTRRGLSLNFEMDTSFLSSIHSSNRKAKWILSIANNHACDNSMGNNQDVSGIEKTIDNIKSVIPDAEVIGAEIGSARTALSLRLEDGPTLGFVGWTEVMNRDYRHYKKKIIRETDLADSAITQIKDKVDMLFGFAHGNEEQSYSPLKETRDRWRDLLCEHKFDVIVGHGPHVLQPAEQVGEKGLLFHSIGNYCSPIGKSQTKVGAIPELTIHYSKEGISFTDYKINILEQDNGRLSLIQDLNTEPQKHPDIISRLRRIWKPLSFNPA